MVLKELCKRVGVKYEDMDFTKSDWYLDHTWSRENEKDFIKWLGKFLIDNRYVPKSFRTQAEHEASKLVMQYGWKTV